MDSEAVHKSREAELSLPFCEFFHFDEINQVFSLDSSLEPYAGPTLASASGHPEVPGLRTTSPRDIETLKAATKTTRKLKQLRHGRRSRKG